VSLLTTVISDPVLYGYGPLDAMNALKHSIEQSEDRILQINQSKNASKHL